MAGVAGFEPAHAGIKTRCLTAWRHPSNRERAIVRIRPMPVKHEHLKIKELLQIRHRFFSVLGNFPSERHGHTIFALFSPDAARFSVNFCAVAREANLPVSIVELRHAARGV